MQTDRPLFCVIGLCFFLVGRPADSLAEPGAHANLLPAAQLDEIDGQTRSELRLFERYVDQQQWPEAIDIVRKLTDTNGQQIVVRPGRFPGFDRGVRLTAHLHSRLAVLSGRTPGLLEEFRFRTDTHVERLYRSAVRHRSASQLQQIQNDYFSGSFGDDALLLLGEIELAIGHYDAARRLWRRLHRDLAVDYSRTPTLSGYSQLWGIRGSASEENKVVTSDGLSHPNSDIPLHEVRARLIYVSILEGNIERAKAELRHYSKLHPRSVGRLGGRTVDLNAELAALITNTAKRKKITGDSWNTIGSNPRRKYLGDKKILLRRQPLWRIKLSHPAGEGEQQAGRDESLFFRRSNLTHHPIFIDNDIFFSNQHAIFAHELATGKPVSWADSISGQIYALDSSDVAATSLHEHFTLTASDSRLYAQLGISGTGEQSSSQVIVGIDLKSEGRLAFDPIRPVDAAWSFNGCPLAEDERIYFAKSKESGVTETYVTCHENANRVWQRKICSSELSSVRQSILLSLNEDTLYANTNRGVVAALDKQNGKIRWIVRYPRTLFSPVNLLGQPWFHLRSPNPCIVADEMIFVAPRDYEGIFALDSQTGQLIWKMEVLPGWFDAVDLWGITNRQLFASGRRLWWIDRFRGVPTDLAEDNPFPRELHGPLQGHGRGLISGGDVFWPCRANGADWIYVFDATTGQRHRQPIDLSAVQVGAGHLLATKDLLIVTNEKEMVAFQILR